MRASLLSLLVPPASAFGWVSFSGVQEQPVDLPTAQHFNATAVNGTSQVEWTYTGTALDGPKVNPVNRTTFDWWHFDAVSAQVATGDFSSIRISFYAASPESLGVLSNEATILDTSVSGTFANGTSFSFHGFPSSAVSFTKGDSSDGRWGGYSSWSSSLDLSHWMIEFADAHLNVSGYMSLASHTPPHLPCGLQKGATERAMPHIGWTNSVPDAYANVGFEIGQSSMTIDQGVGYHDKKWGDRPLFESIRSWYWGHGRLGPYSIVWFDGIGVDGVEYSSSYVAKNGTVLATSCAEKAVLVRPEGGDETFPPTQSTGSPNGFSITYANVDGRELRINVSNLATAEASKVYDQWVGKLEGAFMNENLTLVGVALYEEFKL